MASYRPEGLSPRFSSIISPDIPESFRLEWTFRKRTSKSIQQQAVIELFLSGVTTPFKTITVTGDDKFYNLSDITDVVWESSQDYQWQVTTYDFISSTDIVATTSVKATFLYAEVPSVEDVVFETGPVAYERLGARQYFNTISQNALILLSDYEVDSTAEQAIYDKVVENLFTGDIVPSRSDFRLLEEVIQFLYAKEDVKVIVSQGGNADVEQLVEDGLGANDIHKVYDFFTLLMKKPPKPPEAIKVTMPAIPETPKVTDINFISSGKEDNAVDIIWEGNNAVDRTGSFEITEFGKSEDVRYYYLEYSYGDKNSPFVCKMYYRPEDLTALGNKITFYMRYPDVIAPSKINQVHHGLSAWTIDVRNNRSQDSCDQMWTAPSNYKYPMGLDYYEVTYQKGSLTATTANTKGFFSALYKGDLLKTTHKLAKGQEGVYFYRARYIDLTGLISEWEYTTGNKFDPLKPPAKPAPTASKITQTTFTISWKSVPTAESYEIDPTYNSNFYAQSALSKDFTGASADNSYKIAVRAKNRAGVSAWAYVTVKTKPRPVVTTEKKYTGADCWRTPFTVNGRHYSGGWRNESWDAAKNQLIQGMWIELRSGINTDGIWVPKGTSYGNHKSLAFFDYDYWQDTLKGKEILEVKLWLQRLSTRHGYPNDGRYIKVWTHNYSKRPSGEPTLSNGTEIWNTNYGRGDAHYVTLPKKFGELIRDGKAKGIALHTDFRTSDTDRYTYCRFDESKIKLSIKYK